MTLSLILYGTIIDGDCSGLIPPCWQELHYLFAGILIGHLVGLFVATWLFHWWCR